MLSAGIPWHPPQLQCHTGMTHNPGTPGTQFHSTRVEESLSRKNIWAFEFVFEA